MEISLFDFELPDHLIATQPSPSRDGSRLLVLGGEGPPIHGRFSAIGEYLRAGDLLVLNDTRVLPARLLGERTGGGLAELLLLEPQPGEGTRWTALVKPGRRLREGAAIRFSGTLTATIEGVLESGERIVRFDHSGDFHDRLAEVGRMPLPPYILRARERSPEPVDDWDEIDRERYQTVYAARAGSVAAPTAGLHFTRELLDRLDRSGIGHTTVTLHVGAGTFKPVTAANSADHEMHEERWFVPAETAERIASARAAGGRIVAVGTTSVRTLESAAASCGRVEPGDGATRLLIEPGYRFRAVDAIVTNFHLPKSTLLLLVSAFAGRERILAAYAEAIAHGYRFFSYGDAMLLTGGNLVRSCASDRAS